MLNYKQFFIYLGRWQLSTIILGPCIALIPGNALTVAIVANLIGGCIFYWVDKWIFKKQ